MARHRAAIDHTPKKRASLVASILTALVLVTGAPALAHNHLANPSGVCNESGQGTSPGNSGETLFNPAGKPVGQANADKSQGDENCNK